MKRIISVLMIMAMVSNTAFAGVTSEGNASHASLIAKAFNQFQYKMTVSIDPKDPHYQETAVAEFKAKVAKLQSEGVTPVEIMDYTRSTLLNEQTRADFDRMLAAMDSQKISGEDAGNIAMKFMADKYQKGANYSGGQRSYTWAAIVVGIVIVGVVTYIVIKNRPQQEQPRTETLTNTNTETGTITETNTDTCTYTQTETDTCSYTFTATGTVTISDQAY